MRHLLTGCPFSRAIWYEVLSWILSTAGPLEVEDDFVESGGGWLFDLPPHIAERNLVACDADGMMDMEAPERGHLRQCESQL
jgi:hypothetical protein